MRAKDDHDDVEAYWWAKATANRGLETKVR